MRLAFVVRYDSEHDLALLLVHQKGYGATSVKFSSGVPKEGDGLWHVGNMRGRPGDGSVSEGVVAGIGRLRKGFKPSDTRGKHVFDQYSIIAHKGSSGGGVFSKDTGECVGLCSQFLTADDDGFSHGSLLAVPARRIREYAKSAKVEYAVDDTIKSPSREEIKASTVTTSEVKLPADWPTKKEAKPEKKDDVTPETIGRGLVFHLSLLMPTRQLYDIFEFLGMEIEMEGKR